MADSLAADQTDAGPPTPTSASPAARHSTHLTRRAKSLYAAGDAVDGVVSNAVGYFLLFYLNVACGLSGTLAGLVLFISLCVDAVADPAIGFWSDNARFRLGRRHPFMFVAAPIVALALGLMFSIPPALTGGALFAYILVVLVTLRVSQSAYILPFVAMGAELSDDYAERSSVVTFRYGANIVFNCSQLVLGLWVFMYGAARNHRESYIPYGWLCAALVLAGALVAAFGTLPLRARMHPVSSLEGEALRRVPRELKEVFSNPSFRTLFFGILVFWVPWGALGALSLHANSFFWKMPPQVIATIPLFLIGGLVLGVPISAVVLRRFEKLTVCLIALAIVCGLVALPAPLRVLGLIPADGVVLYGGLAAQNFLVGVGTTSVVVSFWSMMADAADEHEALFGTRREGLYFASITLSAKFASAIGGWIAGRSLDLIGFPHDLATAGQHPIAQGTLNALGLIQGTGCGLAAAIAIAILARYRLGSKKLGALQAELAARRAAV
jgi:GPH family glycoside/pentoside/hexuronide:cation symporter